MKKLVLIACIAALSVAANAQLMDNFSRTWSLVTTNSDTAAEVLRGEIAAVWVDVAATKTNVVTVTDPYGTIFSATVAADTLYPIVVPLYGTTGSALTETSYGYVPYVGTNAVYAAVAGTLSVSTNSWTNPLYGPRPVAGKVTIRAAGAADTTGTNSVTVTVIYKR